MPAFPAWRTRPDRRSTPEPLADSSLVQPETREDEPRFRLLETVREYALERLRDSGAWQEAHDRHAAYFTALAKPTEFELQGEGQLAWLNRLEAEAGKSGRRPVLADGPGPA